jgi:translation elongation factor EF-G
MEPSHYEPVPTNIAEEIRKKTRIEPEAAGSRR